MNILNKPLDPVNDSLEDFYGDSKWLSQKDSRTNNVVSGLCPVYRVPGGRVKCNKVLNHPGNVHSGYDSAFRRHTWTTPTKVSS